MSRNDFETKSLVIIVLIGYVLNLFFGWLGVLFTHESAPQILLFQIGNAFAISASVMAGRYIGLRGQHVAASACILLGITHGISLAAVSREGINADREATMAMPMIPALLFMSWCTLYPKWLRASVILPIVLFGLVYVHVHAGGEVAGWRLYAGYGTLQLIEVLWAVYLFLDWKKSAAAAP
jgi:hypothetical protein